MNTPYRGRFAPTPSGPLHFGSLVAALGSYLDARANRGAWLLRIEDLDTPRNAPGALDEILRQLEACALEWDEAIEYQSANLARYEAALAQLRARGAVFECSCSRREIADSSVRGIEGPVYAGTCRRGADASRWETVRAAAARRPVRSWRAFAPDEDIAFDDLLQGPQSQNVARAVGDFIVHRASAPGNAAMFAYQLAVVVDDAAQGITRVVRGADLLHSTARQIVLQRALDLPTPQYAHLPLALKANGDKWSKQTHAPPIEPARASNAVATALQFLGHRAPGDLRGAPARELLDWGVAHWRLERVPREMGRVA
jgi:glutamyl-Q tRNA(Asp) synthetase